MAHYRTSRHTTVHLGISLHCRKDGGPAPSADAAATNDNYIYVLVAVVELCERDVGNADSPRVGAEQQG